VGVYRPAKYNISARAHTYTHVRARIPFAHTHGIHFCIFVLTFIHSRQHISDARRRDWVCYRIPLMGGGRARLACVHVCEENRLWRRRRRTPRKRERESERVTERRSDGETERRRENER